MNRPTLAAALGVVLTGLVLGAQPPEAGLDIYWIDVEGGAATLVVTRPSGGRSSLDAGWARSDERDACADPGRHAGRRGRPHRLLHRVALSRRPRRRPARPGGPRAHRPARRPRRQRRAGDRARARVVERVHRRGRGPAAHHRARRQAAAARRRVLVRARPRRDAGAAAHADGPQPALRRRLALPGRERRERQQRGLPGLARRVSSS